MSKKVKNKKSKKNIINVTHKDKSLEVTENPFFYTKKKVHTFRERERQGPRWEVSRWRGG